LFRLGDTECTPVLCKELYDIFRDVGTGKFSKSVVLVSDGLSQENHFIDTCLKFFSHIDHGIGVHLFFAFRKFVASFIQVFAKTGKIIKVISESVHQRRFVGASFFDLVFNVVNKLFLVGNVFLVFGGKFEEKIEGCSDALTLGLENYFTR
jgi:hypothetical protein